MNSVNVVGRLTRDPELRHTQNGTPVCSFRLAVDRAGDKEDDGSYGAGFFDVTAWSRVAELVDEYLAKGRQVAVSGELRHHTWENDEGERRSKVEINARMVTFLGSKSDAPARSRDKDADDADDDWDDPKGDGSDDDIPF